MQIVFFTHAIASIHLFWQLLASGRIKGELSGKRFTPDSFIQAQKRAIKEFFQSNGCISWSRVEALQVKFVFPVLRSMPVSADFLRSPFLEVPAASNSGG
jgi:hypothetical protein